MWNFTAILLLACAAAAGDLRATLVPEKTAYEIGEPILIAIRIRNTGKGTQKVEQDYFGTFHDAFIVKDAAGKVLKNPYAGHMPMKYNGRVREHTLEPGDEVVIERMLNECVRFDRPGVYTVTARHWPGEPVRLTLRDYDKRHRQDRIGAFVHAHRNNVRLDASFFQLNTPKKYVFNAGRLGLVRLLVFFHDPKLIPFFLEVIEQEDSNRYALNGLLSLRDRAAVLTALERRLSKPESHDLTKLLYPYQTIKVPWAEGVKDVFEQREAVTAAYRDRELELLKKDKAHRYAHLVPILFRRGNDEFLIDYLLHSRPKRRLLGNCAWTMQRVNVNRVHIPYLESLLRVRNDWHITDAAITVLLKLDRKKYLPILEAESKKPPRERNFSSGVFKLLRD